jgi:carbonic anhydrase
MYQPFTILYIVIFVVACQPASNDGGGENDPHQSEVADDARSYLLPGLDHGLLQSPINILSDEAATSRHNITLNFNGDINMVENLGHTIQLDLEPGNTITIDERTFDFKQMHFHTPSEHLIDGITYPMEMHVVNTLKDQPKGETTEYLVMAFLIKMGEKNAFIANFIDQIPKEEGEVGEIDLNVLKDSRMSTVANLINELHSCYHYKGSLTTPPYTESVSWYVMKRIFEASPEQIKRINEIEGDNARHIQKKYERKISEE